MAILLDPISDFFCIFDNIDTYQLNFFWSIKQEAIWLLFYLIPFWLCLCLLLCPLPSQLIKEGRASPWHQGFDPTGYTIIPARSRTLLTNEEAGPCDQESLSTLKLFSVTLCYQLFFERKILFLPKFKILKILTTGKETWEITKRIWKFPKSQDS